MTVLGDLVDIRTGKLDANAAVADGNYPFFTCAEKISYIDIYAFDADAIIVAGNGDLNVKHYKGKFNAYQRTYVITIPDETLIDSRYLFHWMSKYITKLRAMSIGGVIKYIKLGMLADATLPLPPLAEQKRIAAILDKADALRRKREKAIQLTDTLLKSVFLDMFGDPVTNPKGWETVSLSEHIQHSNNGLSRRRKTAENTGNIVLRLQDVRENEIDYTRCNRIMLDKSEEKRFALEKDDLLFVRVNGNRDYVGRCAVFSGFSEPVFHNDHLIRLRMGPNFDPYFLAYLFNLRAGRSLLSGSIKTSAGQHTISQDGLKKIKFPAPSKKLQSKFKTFFKCLEKNKTILESQAQKNSTLFASLSQRAFRGELTAKDIDKIEAA